MECPHCHNQSSVGCTSCNGVGTIVCEECSGRGQVVRYIELRSEFENYQIVDIIARGGLTKEYLNMLTGKLIYQYVYEKGMKNEMKKEMN